mmetsp:Transcript_91510/g.255634  ORF Transcript_91510/g.255634 Transcript_91510/m.255634 type:complete len:110 (-) Transcript_91510:333-662(-)
MPFSTGLCECCAAPGGCGLCVRTVCCPCTVLGDINEYTKTCPCGFVGGCCCGTVLHPCFFAAAAPKVMPDENACKACCCTYSCGGLYVMQVYREILIQKGAAPSQMEMK